MKCRLIDLSVSVSGKQRLTVEIDGDARQIWDDLHDHDVELTARRWHRKRSLDANAYCWVLLDKLAARTGVSKLEAYREAIRGIGGVSTTVCAKDARAADSLAAAWSRNGMGWFAEQLPSKLPGCVNVVLYYGSSTYDSAQMAALIDHIIQDCKAVGIETATPQEIAAMNAAWQATRKESGK